MDSDVYRVPAFHQMHGLHELELHVEEIGDDYVLSGDLPLSHGVIIGQASDCHAALQELRRQAEPVGWLICCLGSRRNVWPSGMSRDMGGGLKAYTLELGEPGRLDSLVEIFHPDSPEHYCPVIEQEAFYAQWCKSIQEGKA